VPAGLLDGKGYYPTSGGGRDARAVGAFEAPAGKMVSREVIERSTY